MNQTPSISYTNIKGDFGAPAFRQDLLQAISLADAMIGSAAPYTSMVVCDLYGMVIYSISKRSTQAEV